MKDREPTYQLVTVDGLPAIACRLCGAVSTNPHDSMNLYCGRCHLFHDVVEEGRRLLAFGGTHECAEWRTAANTCALCEAALQT